MADLMSKVEGLIRPTLEAMGYDLVRVQIMGGGRPVLQIMAERLDGGGMTVDDCADISRAVSAVLDVEDPIPSAYALEVSSPGIDRPLVRLADFDRFAGYEAKLEMKQPINGQRRFKGKLAGTDGDDVRMETETGPVRVKLALIQRAKLVLTDELLAQARKQQERAAANDKSADA
ncbi:MAG: ribosome maturation factor RimP [Alphaproteobacteria bacterium]